MFEAQDAFERIRKKELDQDDEDVIVIEPALPRDAGGQEYELPDIKLIVLEKDERRKFCSDYGFYDAVMGKMEEGDTLLSRDDIREWTVASLHTGTLHYLIRKCPVEGDVS